MAIKSIKPKKVIDETPVKQTGKPGKPSYAIPRFSTLTTKPCDTYLINMLRRIRKVNLPSDKKDLVNFVIAYHESGESPYHLMEDKKIIIELKKQLENFTKEQADYIDSLEKYRCMTND